MAVTTTDVGTDETYTLIQTAYNGVVSNDPAVGDGHTFNIKTATDVGALTTDHTNLYNATFRIQVADGVRRKDSGSSNTIYSIYNSARMGQLLLNCAGPWEIEDISIISASHGLSFSATCSSTYYVKRVCAIQAGGSLYGFYANSATTYTIQLEHCSAINFLYGFYCKRSGVTGYYYNCTALNCVLTVSSKPPGRSRPRTASR